MKIYRVKLRDKVTGTSHWVCCLADSKRDCFRRIIAILIKKNIYHELEIRKIKKGEC